MKFKLLFSYRFLLFILSVIGVYLQLTKHGGFGMMLYYTILSNVTFFIISMDSLSAAISRISSFSHPFFSQ